MPRCPTCDAELDANARFCPKDGTTIRPDSMLLDVSALAQVARAAPAAQPRQPPATPPFGHQKLGATPPAGAPRLSPTPATGTLRQPTPPTGTPRQPTPPTGTPRATDVTPRKTTGRARRSATANPEDDPLIGRLIDGRYRVDARLGEGGVGAVYQVEHAGTKKALALKLLHPLYAANEEFGKRFEREARSASRLSHPGIVQVIDFGHLERIEPDLPRLHGAAYLVMELVRGTLLLDRLMDGPPFLPEEAVAVAKDALLALKHAHALGIVHRDLKPANLMLVQPGAEDTLGTRLKLLDFGLAKDLEREGDGPTAEAPLTQAGMVFGTPGYLSPEQAAGRKVDSRSDLYSLGVVLFEMVCHRRLFERKDPLDAVRDHLHTPPADPRSINPRCSKDLAQVILRALEKQPERRWPSAEAFLEALTRVPEATGAPARRKLGVDSVLELLARRGPAGRPVWQWSAAALAVLAIVAAATAGTRKPPEPEPPVALEAPPRPRLSDGAQRALALLGQDRADDAVQAARAALKDDPHDGAAHLALGGAYARKLWCSDALEELDRAVRDQPALRDDPELAQRAIRCLGPKTQSAASRFLTERLGPSARPSLESAAASDPNPEVRKAAQRLLEKL